MTTGQIIGLVALCALVLLGIGGMIAAAETIDANRSEKKC